MVYKSFHSVSSWATCTSSLQINLNDKSAPRRDGGIYSSVSDMLLQQLYHFNSHIIRLTLAVIVLHSIFAVRVVVDT